MGRGLFGSTNHLQAAPVLVPRQDHPDQGDRTAPTPTCAACGYLCGSPRTLWFTWDSISVVYLALCGGLQPLFIGCFIAWLATLVDHHLVDTVGSLIFKDFDAVKSSYRFIVFAVIIIINLQRLFQGLDLSSLPCHIMRT